MKNLRSTFERNHMHHQASTKNNEHAKRTPHILIAALSVCLLVPAAAFSSQESLAFASSGQAESNNSYASNGEGTNEAEHDNSSSSTLTNNKPVEKTQVVYVSDDAYGSQKGVYVVNTFKADREVQIRDTGRYTSVENLTDSQELASNGSSFTVPAENDFVYRGTMDAESATPWNIQVSYRLDGKDITPENLSGASGNVEMTLNVTPNESCSGPYADNYLLQITGSLDTATTHNLSAESATIAQSGDDTQLSYMVFPGKSAQFTVDADVTNFSFSGWQIAGVPLSIALDIDSNDFSDASSELANLSNAIASVNDGANRIADASESLDSGLKELTAQNNSLINGSTQMHSALEAIEQGTRSFSDALSNSVVTGIEKIASGSSDYAQALSQNSNQYSNVAASINTDAVDASYKQALASYNQAVQTYTSIYSETFASAYASYIQNGYDSANAQSLAAKDATTAAANQSNLSSAQATLMNAITNMTQAHAEKQGNQSAADALASALDSYNDINDGLQSMVDTNSESSIYSLIESAQQLRQGTQAASNGSAELQEGIRAYSNGADSASQGADELANGSETLANGTQQLTDQTANLDQDMIEEIQNKLESFLNPKFQMMDFANGSVNNISRVQFVYVTDAI